MRGKLFFNSKRMYIFWSLNWIFWNKLKWEIVHSHNSQPWLELQHLKIQWHVVANNSKYHVMLFVLEFVLNFKHFLVVLVNYFRSNSHFSSIIVLKNSILVQPLSLSFFGCSFQHYNWAQERWFNIFKLITFL